MEDFVYTSEGRYVSEKYLLKMMNTELCYGLFAGVMLGVLLGLLSRVFM